MNKTIILGLLLLTVLSVSASPPTSPYPWCIDQSSIARDNTRPPTTLITFPFGWYSIENTVTVGTSYHYSNVILNAGDIESAIVCWSDGLCISREDVQWIHEQRGK